MGKKNSKQAWISREGPEGDCVLVSDATIAGRGKILEELLLQKHAFGKSGNSSESTYKGYHANLNISDSDDLEIPHLPSLYKELHPLEVALPAKPDGKREAEFVREGMINASTQTKQETEPEIIAPLVTEIEDIPAPNMSVVSATPSDKQEWSYTLYDFEGQGRGVSKEELANLVRSIYEVLGKSVHKAKKKSRQPLSKVLKVQLSISKDGKNERAPVNYENQETDQALTQGCRHYRARQKYLSQTKFEPLGAHLNDENIQQTPNPWMQRDHSPNPPIGKHLKDCLCARCEQKKFERKLLKKQKELFPYPKRTQTYPGQSFPENEHEINKRTNNNAEEFHQYTTEKEDKNEHRKHDKMEHKHRHRPHRHHCQRHSEQEQYSQYLDLAIDPIFEKHCCRDSCHKPGCSYYQASPPPVCQKQGGLCNHGDGHHRFRHHCHHYHKSDVTHPVEQIIRHEHHHHHSHHHYYHYK